MAAIRTLFTIAFFSLLRLLHFAFSLILQLLYSLLSHPSLNLPLFLGKAPDGTFPLWSSILFAPFLFLVCAFTAIRRIHSGEPPYTQISQGLYVGGWPYLPDRLPPGNPAIIDCTCELPRNKWLSGNAYLCIPTWDVRAPHPDQIQAAVDWACKKRAQNTPIFIHCAYGHWRSITVMCAVLVALGLAGDWRSAENMIKRKRPYVHLNVLHRRALEEWSKRCQLSPQSLKS